MSIFPTVYSIKLETKAMRKFAKSSQSRRTGEGPYY